MKREVVSELRLPSKGTKVCTDDGCLERAARSEVESRAGRTLTDAEWATMRARLIDFAAVLRTWQRKASAVALEVRKAA